MSQYHESTSGKFLRSTGGGLTYYGTLVAAPLALIFSLATGGPDYNKTTNPDSQAALSAYTHDGNSLSALLEDAETLREVALSQNSAETVLEMRNEAAARETQAKTLGETFVNSVLTDSRLTEGDYSALLENLTIDETDYVDMPWMSPALDEARAGTTGTKAEQSAAIRAYMDDAGDADNTRNMLILATFIFSLCGGLIFVTDSAESVRRGLSYKLDDMAQKRIKPKH